MNAFGLIQDLDERKTCSDVKVIRVRVDQFRTSILGLQRLEFHFLALPDGFGFPDKLDKRSKVLSPLFEENGFICIQNSQQVQPHQVFGIVEFDDLFLLLTNLINAPVV